MTRIVPNPWNDEPLGHEPRGYDVANTSGRDGLLDLGLSFVSLARRNWLLFALFIVGAVGFTEYRRRTDRPTYRARAVIPPRDRAGMLRSEEHTSELQSRFGV